VEVKQCYEKSRSKALRQEKLNKEKSRKCPFDSSSDSQMDFMSMLSSDGNMQNMAMFNSLMDNFVTKFAGN
jgi:hypothetical protein